MGEWFADESFWTQLYPFLFSDRRMASAAGEIDGVLSLVPNRGASVLDLCCGPGRHSIELSRRGFDVTGVDLSRFLLARAREQADAAGVHVDWVEADAREFVRPDAYDLAINLYTSFGYFDEPGDDLRVLRNVHRSLRPGAALLLEMTGKESLAEGFQPTTAVDGPEGSLLVERHEIIDDWSRIRNEWILIRDGQAKTFRFSHRLFSGTELCVLLERAGFERTVLYGDLDGDSFGVGSPRLVAMALKAS